MQQVPIRPLVLLKPAWRIVMRAMDVMTSEVITVDENASVQTVAKLMAKHGISAVPVVDKDKQP